MPDRQLPQLTRPIAANPEDSRRWIAAGAELARKSAPSAAAPRMRLSGARTTPRRSFGRRAFAIRASPTQSWLGSRR